MKKRPLQPGTDGAEQRRFALRKELQNQTDRGAVIVATAWVDDLMTTALHSVLQDHTEAWNQLFGRGGALSTMSAKIDMLTLLGVISPGVRSALDQIRKIRNQFAHDIVHHANDEELSFETPSIADSCKNLGKVLRSTDELSTRDLFIFACTTLASEFEIVWMMDAKVEDLGYVKLPSEVAA